jgi:APA family basic amino acid/polyamine antiporter
MLFCIAGFIIYGFFSGQGSTENLTTPSLQSDHPVPQGWNLLKALFIASLGAFWGYEGWNNIAYIGEEVKNPKKILPMALGVGTLIVIVAYVLLNTLFVYLLPIDFFIGLKDYMRI